MATLMLGLALGAAGGLMVGWTLRDQWPAPAGSRTQAAALAARWALLWRPALEQRKASVLTVCVGLALVGAILGQIGVPRALLVGLFSGVAVIASGDLSEAVRATPLELRSSWGGLGGGLGGLQVSRPAVLLLVAIVFAGAALMAGVAPKQEPMPATEKSFTGRTSVTVTHGR